MRFLDEIPLYLLLFILVTVSQQTIIYRLPKDSVPYHYKIKVIPHLILDNFTFDGETEIFLEIVNPTRNITLNSFKLEIHQESTILTGEGENIRPHQHIIEEEPQFLILNFRDDLEPGFYILQLKYNGVLNEAPEGFFWDYYYDGGYEQTFLAATQFETTHAREAFPCWDEPSIKATFDISIKHFPNYTALSNMPMEKQVNEKEIDGKVWSKFQTTHLMSTYLVCFTVSDFKSITNSYGNFSVWSRENVLDSMEYGYNVSLKAFPVLEEYTGIPYEFPKMDVIAVPGFGHGAMENWGLIVVKEMYLLNDNSSFDSELFTTSIFMVHEIAHQWFGNLVTPAWWKDVWVTEGLATYFHYFLTAKVINFPRIMDFFVVRNNFKVFRMEAVSKPLAIFRDINSPKEANELFVTVHDKGATVMHMLSSLLSEEVFHTGIKKLLQRYKFKAITTDDFWNTMQETMIESKLPHSGFDIKMVLEPYVSQTGYPVINVFRDYTTGTIKLTQECIVCEEHIFNNTTNKWWVPINIAKSSSLNFSSTFATHWMDPEEDELIIEGIDPEDWYIINIQGFGYYRVNYDERNWNKISAYMNSDKFSNIHVVNRAKLLDDAFWLLKQEKLDRSFLINLSSYLTREVDYIPWVPGDWILKYFWTTSKNTNKFKKFVLRLVQALIEDTGVKEKTGDDFLTNHKRNIALTWTCRVASLHCDYIKW